ELHFGCRPLLKRDLSKSCSMTSTFLIIALLFVLIAWLMARSNADKQKKDWEKEKFQLQDQLQQTTNSLTQANNRVQQLRKYEIIEDAEAEAKIIKANADIEARRLHSELEEETAQARASLKTELSRERADINLIKSQATARKARIELDYNAAIIKATDSAKDIVSAAKKHALEIGTYTVEQARDMQAALTAVENRINGYGDKFLKSTYSIMDDLAEEFSYKDAGEKLKAARDVTRALVANNRAAACDYVEPERKNTAVNFVLDAFNGKVEVILSRVKKDNFGTLEQEIKDAFSI